MKKIVELLFCLVALVALLICAKYSDNVENVETEEVCAAINAENQNPAAENVAMLGNQE